MTVLAAVQKSKSEEFGFLKVELEAMADSDDKVEAEFRYKIVAWLKEHNYYAVLHDGHFGRYFHVRTLDDTCDELTNEIYSAFLESYDCEFYDKGKLVIDYNLHLDAKFTWEWLYKRVVLNEQLPEDRRCEVCGKELTDEEYYTCAEHTKPITFKI